MKVKKVCGHFGISILLKNYDIRLGLLRLGRPAKYYPLLKRIKDTLYHNFNNDIEIQVINTYFKRNINQHYRFLWFAIGWRKIK